MGKLTMNSIPRYDESNMDVPEVASKPLQQVTSPRGTGVWMTLLPWFVSGLASFILFVCVLVLVPVESWFYWKNTAIQYLTRNEYVIADDAVMGDGFFDITIRRAHLKQPGWLIVSAPVWFDYACNTVFGKSVLLPAGTVKDAIIRVPNLPTDPSIPNPQVPLEVGTVVTVGIIYEDVTGEDSIHRVNFVKNRNGENVMTKVNLGIKK